MDILLTIIRFALLILLVALYWWSVAHHEKRLDQVTSEIDDLHKRMGSIRDLLEQQRQAFTRLRKYIEGELADEDKKETS